MTNDGSETTFALFWLYKVAPGWRRLEAVERAHLRVDFARALEGRVGSLTLRGAYSLVGLRHDADLMLWLHGPDLDAAQELAVALRKTGLGTYLENTYTYTGIVPISRYAPEHRPAFVQGQPPRQYLSMYPFVKTSEWYLLPFEQRRALMAEHGRMGQRHSAIPEAMIEEASTGAAVAVAAPSRGAVLANTVHSFALGDQESVVAFESAHRAAIAVMVEDLRAGEVRRYTAADTPIFLGHRKDLPAALDDLG